MRAVWEYTYDVAWLIEAHAVVTLRARLISRAWKKVYIHSSDRIFKKGQVSRPLPRNLARPYAASEAISGPSQWKRTSNW